MNAMAGSRRHDSRSDRRRAVSQLGRHPGQRRARRRRVRGAGSARRRQRSPDAAQRLRDVRGQHGGGPTRRLCRADQLALHTRGGGLHSRRLRGQGAGGAQRSAGADRVGCAGRRQGAGRADTRRDRRRLQRPGGQAPCPRRPRALGRVRGTQRAQHRAAQGIARQHDLHLGHDRAAQGRAPPAGLAGIAGGGDAEIGRYWGSSPTRPPSC